MPSMVFAVQDTFDFPALTVKRVVIENDFGDIMLHGTEDGSAQAVFRKHDSQQICTTTATVEGDTLKVIGKKQEGGDACQVDWQVRVPQNASVHIKAGKSVVSVSGLCADVQLDLGAGRFSSDAPLSKLVVNAGAAEHEIRNMAGDSTFNAGGGTLSMFWDALPSVPQTITCNFSNLRAAFYLPETATVNMDRLVTVGFLGVGCSRTCEFPTTAHNALFRFTGAGMSGAFEVKKNQP